VFDNRFAELARRTTRTPIAAKRLSFRIDASNQKTASADEAVITVNAMKALVLEIPTRRAVVAIRKGGRN
jgi:hypothetical protein